jgi:hypothetical protein
MHELEEYERHAAAKADSAKAETNRVCPFYCAHQYADWLSINCWHCKKYTGRNGACEIDDALTQASWGDGMVSADLAKRMGYSYPLPYCWQCPEKVDDGW